MNKTTPQAPAPSMPIDELGNTDIDGVPALACMSEDAGVILTGRGVARCHSALSGIKSITDVLLQLELDKDSTNGIQASTRTASGLLQALAVCAEFVNDHIKGQSGVAFEAQSVKGDSPAYVELQALHLRTRMEAAS